MTSTSLTCFRCKFSIELGGSKVFFRDSCVKCQSDLHCCKNCSFYDPSCYNGCREPQAERVLDKENANRCDFFRPGNNLQGSDKSTDAKKKLDDLFK